MTGDQSRLLKPLALANARDAVKALIVAKRVLGIGSLRTDVGCFAPLYARKVQDLHGVSTMAEITYYVALPLLFTDDGILLGDAVECPAHRQPLCEPRLWRENLQCGCNSFLSQLQSRHRSVW